MINNTDITPTMLRIILKADETKPSGFVLMVPKAVKHVLPLHPKLVLPF